METDIQLRLLYSQRPEWEDVSPVFVDDGNCVVAVQYTAEHRDAWAYFRAILASGEKSERVLDMTAELIGFNQADYTAWQYRWLCVEALGSDLETENELTREVMKDNAKNYQLWNHRRKCALKAGPSAAQQELDFAMQALSFDEKNYHAWVHRMSIVQAFGLWEDEIVFVEKMIGRDVRNNSAWNQRAVVVRHMLLASTSIARGGGSSSMVVSDEEGGEAVEMDEGSSGDRQEGDSGVREALDQVLQRELGYVAGQIQRAPRNESSWNYLLGLFTLPGCRRHEALHWPKLHGICVSALAQAPSCPLALAALAEYYTTVAEAAMQHVVALKERQPPAQTEELQAGLTALRAAVVNATSLLDGLTFADPMRNMYWMHRHQVLHQMLVQAAPNLATD